MEEKKSMYASPKDCKETIYGILNNLSNSADAVPDECVSHLRKCRTCLEWACLEVAENDGLASGFYKLISRAGRKGKIDTQLRLMNYPSQYREIAEHIPQKAMRIILIYRDSIVPDVDTHYSDVRKMKRDFDSVIEDAALDARIVYGMSSIRKMVDEIEEQAVEFESPLSGILYGLSSDLASVAKPNKKKEKSI